MPGRRRGWPLLRVAGGAPKPRARADPADVGYEGLENRLARELKTPVPSALSPSSASASPPRTPWVPGVQERPQGRAPESRTTPPTPSPPGALQDAPATYLPPRLPRRLALRQPLQTPRKGPLSAALRTRLGVHRHPGSCCPGLVSRASGPPGLGSRTPRSLHGHARGARVFCFFFFCKKRLSSRGGFRGR